MASDLTQVGADLAAFEAQTSDRRAIQDKLVRNAFRLAATGSAHALVVVSAPQREAFEELLRMDTELRSAHARLTERTAELARVQGTAAAKQRHLRNLRDRARIIAVAAENGDASKRAAEVAVLEALAREAASAQTALAQLVASAMSGDGLAPSTWTLPVRGVITQPFGPTALALVPPRTYQGRSYPHFHDAVDFAAPLGAPVRAAADGRVTFVGHLSDGAMVVLIAHPGSLVSVYAHLDDTFARPPVRMGESVAAGQVVGFVGLTGITTGPHLHFAVLRNGEPVDPLSLLASR